MSNYMEILTSNELGVLRQMELCSFVLNPQGIVVDINAHSFFGLQVVKTRFIGKHYSLLPPVLVPDPQYVAGVIEYGECRKESLRISEDGNDVFILNSVDVGDFNLFKFSAIRMNLSEFVNFMSVTTLTDTQKLFEFLDPVSGLHTERFFEQQLQLLIQETTGTTSILMFHIDQLDQMNVTLQERVIRGCAMEIKGNIRQTDILCRIGDRELGLIAVHIPEFSPRTLAEKLRNVVVQSERLLEITGYTVTCSVGYSTYRPGIDENRNILLNRVRMAMYRAHAAGGNKISIG